MNKIFRVIWNHSTQTWQAVSELAKGQTKSESSQATADAGLKLAPIFSLSVLSLALFSTMPAYGVLQITGGSGNTVSTNGGGSDGSVYIIHTPLMIDQQKQALQPMRGKLWLLVMRLMRTVLRMVLLLVTI